MKIILGILAVALVAVLGAGGYLLYDRMTDGDVSLPSVSLPDIKLPELFGGDQSSSAAPAAAPDKGTVTIGSTKKPGEDFSAFDALAAAAGANRDTVAWIQLEGAEVNDSVLQSNDNLYYERRDERGNYEVYGCYFLDYECPMGPREVLANNTVIYGHSAPGDDPDGKRFSKLFRFTDIEFARQNPCIFLTSAEESMVFEIFAVFYTDTSFDYILVHISDDQMLEIGNRAKELSLYDYGVELSADDKLLTLSTCSERDHSDGTGRFVVMGRLMEEGSMGKDAAELTAR